ncbi:hypothetical protein BASA82_000349 [Batrachochytrium salamandrivorans]|nr:hypothetical protein BASA82_000349 [Batrachochytrium salamandrivorans]
MAGAQSCAFGYSSSVNGASSSGGTKSKNNNNLNAQEDEKKNRTVIKFFSRAFKLGVAMACCLLVCAIGMGLIAFTLTQYTANRSFSLEALGTSLSEIGMVGAAYQLLCSWTRALPKEALAATATKDRGQQGEQARGGRVQEHHHQPTTKKAPTAPWKTADGGGCCWNCVSHLREPVGAVENSLPSAAHHWARRQGQVHYPGASPWHDLREEGVAGYFRGNGANCVRVFPYTGVQFLSMNQYSTYWKQVTGRNQLSAFEKQFVGGFAGVTSVLVTFQWI